MIRLTARTGPALNAAAEAIVDSPCAQRLSRRVTTFRISWSVKTLHEQTIIGLQALAVEKPELCQTSRSSSERTSS